METGDGVKRLFVQLSAGLFERVREVADDMQVEPSEVVRLAVRSKLDEVADSPKDFKSSYGNESLN
jgi:metal-responsive CopG/Arc/MetJ family transcriptional regulator